MLLPPISLLLVGASHCLNPSIWFEGAQKVQSAGVGLLGHRMGQKGAESRFGNMEEGDREWLASSPLSIPHSDTQVQVLVLKP